MRIEQFEAILATARNHSMQKSAQELFMTAQNVSKLIKDFEKELNVEVFTRNRYGIFLTREGEYIVNELEGIMDKVRSLKRTYLETSKETIDSSGNIDSLHILSVPAEKDFITELFCRLDDTYAFKGALVSIFDAYAINNLLETESKNVFDEYDMAFISTLTPNPAFLKQIPQLGSAFLLYKSNLGAHFNKNNPLASQNKVSVRDLLAYPLISFIPKDQTTTLQLEALKNLGCIMEPKYIVLDENSCKALIEKDLGFSLVPCVSSILNSVSEGTVIRPLKEIVYFYHILLVNKGLEQKPYYSYIKQFVLNYNRYKTIKEIAL